MAVLTLALVALLASCTTLNFYFTTGDTGSSTTSTGGAGGVGGAGGALLCTPGAERPCYSGPAGTEGQGICEAGAEVCAADGMSWGACVGEVLPGVEDCATAEDEDCDGLAPPCKGNLLWAKRFGDPKNQYGSGVAVDSAGHVAVVGGLSGEVDCGGGVIASAGDSDVLVLQLDAEGQHVWSEGFGGVGYDIGYAVASSNGTATVVLGNFTGTIDFGGGPLVATGPGDLFLAGLGPSGEHLWSEHFGSASGQIAYALALTPIGESIIAGAFYGSIDFGGGLLMTAGAGDVFVAKLDATGKHMWSKRFGDVADHTPYGVAVDAAGNVILVGVLNGSIDFGGGVLSSAGGGDAFVAKLDASGNHLWSRVFGGVSDEIAYAVAVAPSGNIAITGALYGSVDFGGGVLTSSGSSDVFVTMLDPTGLHLWSRRYGDAADQAGHGVALDASGNAAITGSFGGLVDFGGGPLTSAGQRDVFVLKLDAGGSHQWSRRAGAAGSDLGSAVAMDSAGNVVVTGSFSQSVDFGAGPLTSAGGSDIFVAKFGP